MTQNKWDLKSKQISKVLAACIHSFVFSNLGRSLLSSKMGIATTPSISSIKIMLILWKIKIIYDKMKKHFLFSDVTEILLYHYGTNKMLFFSFSHFIISDAPDTTFDVVCEKE